MSRKGAHGNASQALDAVPARDVAALTFSELDDETGSLARELARSYREITDSYRRSMGLTVDEAEAKVRTPREQAVALAETTPPDQVSWWTIAQVTDHDPAAALAVWNRIRDAARQELSSGHRTAQSLEWGPTPWDRARFLALRQAFREDWRPRGGVEAALVDLLAQTFGSYLLWSERVALHAGSQCRAEDSKAAAEGYWVPPRMEEAKWISWCAEQAERAHRRFLMTLKTMQDLRRLPAMRIASVGQVNIAQQQVNVSADEGEGPSD